MIGFSHAINAIESGMTLKSGNVKSIQGVKVSRSNMLRTTLVLIVAGPAKTGASSTTGLAPRATTGGVRKRLRL
jgi:hypothetical protein